MSKNHDQNNTSQPFAPRDWLSAIRDILGDPFILNLFRIDIRSFQRWTAKRPHASEDSIRENYLEKHDTVLIKLMRDGYVDIAQAIVAHHAGIVGCILTPIQINNPDKSSIEDEMLDDYPALVALHAAIRDKMPLDEIRHRAEIAKREIDETVETAVEIKS